MAVSRCPGKRIREGYQSRILFAGKRIEPAPGLTAHSSQGRPIRWAFQGLVEHEADNVGVVDRGSGGGIRCRESGADQHGQDLLDDAEPSRAEGRSGGKDPGAIAVTQESGAELDGEFAELAPPVPGRLDGGDFRTDCVRDQSEQFGFVADVVVERGRADTGALGQPPHSQPVETFLVEQGEGVAD